MSKDTATIDVGQQQWFNKHDAAEYLRSMGFRSITENSIMHAHRTKKLHNGEQRGKKLYWHRDSLNEFASHA